MSKPEVVAWMWRDINGDVQFNYMHPNGEPLIRLTDHEAAMAEETDTAEQWRQLALQFDRHRMSATGLLKAVSDGNATAVDCALFIAEPPVSGRSLEADRNELLGLLREARSVVNVTAETESMSPSCQQSLRGVVARIDITLERHKC